ncbi:hypothetical protein M0804_004307 [Polistes exclamans]|nr:hypothetical protein M0804_004307 [Polistes exclamans]
MSTATKVKIGSRKGFMMKIRVDVRLGFKIKVWLGLRSGWDFRLRVRIEVKKWFHGCVQGRGLRSGLRSCNYLRVKVWFEGLVYELAGILGLSLSLTKGGNLRVKVRLRAGYDFRVEVSLMSGMRAGLEFKVEVRFSVLLGFQGNGQVSGHTRILNLGLKSLWDFKVKLLLGKGLDFRVAVRFKAMMGFQGLRSGLRFVWIIRLRSGKSQSRILENGHGGIFWMRSDFLSCWDFAVDLKFQDRLIFQGLGQFKVQLRFQGICKDGCWDFIVVVRAEVRIGFYEKVIFKVRQAMFEVLQEFQVSSLVRGRAGILGMIWVFVEDLGFEDRLIFQGFWLRSSFRSIYDFGIKSSRKSAWNFRIRLRIKLWLRFKVKVTFKVRLLFKSRRKVGILELRFGFKYSWNLRLHVRLEIKLGFQGVAGIFRYRSGMRSGWFFRFKIRLVFQG